MPAIGKTAAERYNNTDQTSIILEGRFPMTGPYRILIIEDDPEHAELIRMGFRKHDEFFLDFAATGEDGLEMISQDRYDLISVDLVLPGIGGLDVLVRIRRLDPDIPVVMVSGHGTTEMVVVAFGEPGDEICGQEPGELQEPALCL